MTANELLSKKFKRAKMGGYKRSDVDNFMAEVASFISQSSRETAELKRKLEDVSAEYAKLQADRENINEALLNAQRLADSIVGEARSKAERILKEAEIQAQKTVESFSDAIANEQEELRRIKREVASFRSKLLNIYRVHLENINAIPVEREQEQPVPEQPAAAEQTAATQGSPAPKATLAVQEPPASKAPPDAAGEPSAGGSAEAAAAVAPAPDQPEQDMRSGQAPTAGIKLNVRFDEESGEYVPLSNGPSKKGQKQHYKRQS